MLNRKILISSIIYIITRLLILLCPHFSFYSDINFYFLMAEAKFVYHGIPYTDFFCPYPPLFLPIVYIPYLLGGHNLSVYSELFRIEILPFDFMLALYICLFAYKRLNLNCGRTAMVLLIYTFLGLFLFNRMYDEIDIIIAVTIMGGLYHITSGKFPHCIAAYALLSIGTLIKIIPVFFLPLLLVYQYRSKTSHTPFQKILPAAFSVFFIVFFFMAYDSAVSGNLSKYILGHSTRSIQVESVWGSCLQIANIIHPLEGYRIEDEYFCQVIQFTGFPQALLFIASYLEFAILAVFYCLLFISARKDTNSNPEHQLYAFLSTCLIIMIFQRVLSPQYFIWLLPLVSLWTAICGRTIMMLCLVAALYLLLFIGYEIGYLSYISGSPAAVIAVSARNALLIGLCMIVIKTRLPLRSRIYN